MAESVSDKTRSAANDVSTVASEQANYGKEQGKGIVQTVADGAANLADAASKVATGESCFSTFGFCHRGHCAS